MSVSVCKEQLCKCLFTCNFKEWLGARKANKASKANRQIIVIQKAKQEAIDIPLDYFVSVETLDPSVEPVGNEVGFIVLFLFFQIHVICRLLVLLLT